MDHSHEHHDSCCAPGTKNRPDWFMRINLALIVVAVIAQLFLHGSQDTHGLSGFTSSVTELLSRMWWGVLLGIVFVAFLSRVPQEFILAVLGKGGSVGGVVRACFGGVLLDLCSHGILLVGSQLYRRGASTGQVMAFLIASPWNSFSLTFILWSLIGLYWTLAFIVLSMAVAIIFGLMFEALVKRGTLPTNPNSATLPEGFRFWSEVRKGLKSADYSSPNIKSTLLNGVKESRMVLRWLFFGVLLASAIRAFVDMHTFEAYFGATLMGLGLTVLAATVIEVCSEGSTPIAADLMTRAKAPGNSFAFMMAGVSTDYTEIMVLKDTTRSWKIALFLPLVTLPQILLLAIILNTLGG